MNKLSEILQQTIQHEMEDKKQLIRINERIKGLLDIKRFQHDDKVSESLRVKNKEARVRRTKELRKHHPITLLDEEDLRKQKKMSIESLKICPSGVEQRDRLSRGRGAHLLKLFEEDFTKGKMDDKYEEMLEEYISDYSGSIDNNREAFIKKATKDIKEKLFNYYLQEKGRKQSSSDLHPNQLTLETNQYPSIETTKSKQIAQSHTRVRSEDFTIKHYSQHRPAKVMPYILKTPTKFNKVQSQSIYQVYLNQMGCIDQAKRVNEKKRRMKEHSFLMKLREFNPFVLHKK